MPSLPVQRAAEAIARGEGLLVCAGAGMGVDSGLPDFRGDKGFWNAYPPYAKLGLSFMDLANPEWFEKDPTLAWGFYGHRLNIYRKTEPHAGFRLLLSWGQHLKRGVHVFTSNVDGHFQKAGFPAEHVTEVHGSIHYMQCVRDCGISIFPADGVRVEVDEKTFRACEPLPACFACGGLARPNILMFGDGGWDNTRSREQGKRLQQWLREIAAGGLAVIELGAGTAVPTVRLFGEQMLSLRKAGTLIRINPREAEVADRQVSIPLGALDGLRAIQAVLATAGWDGAERA